jgi:hypothetical protein
LERLDGAGLTPETFTRVCVMAGWPEPTYDGVGLWEVDHPSEGTPLILDTVTSPITLLCRLDAQDDCEPEALRNTPLRHSFDDSFLRTAELLTLRFRALGRGTYETPYDWQFAHFLGLNTIIGLEQTYYDPIMGVQLLLLLQPSLAEVPTSPITARW